MRYECWSVAHERAQTFPPSLTACPARGRTVHARATHTGPLACLPALLALRHAARASRAGGPPTPALCAPWRPPARARCQPPARRRRRRSRRRGGGACAAAAAWSCARPRGPRVPARRRPPGPRWCKRPTRSSPSQRGTARLCRGCSVSQGEAGEAGRRAHTHTHTRAGVRAGKESARTRSCLLGGAPPSASRAAGVRACVRACVVRACVRARVCTCEGKASGNGRCALPRPRPARSIRSGAERACVLTGREMPCR